VNKALSFVILAASIAAAAIGAAWWVQRPAPRGEPVEMPLSEIDPEQPFVRVRGTAHYAVVIRQEQPGNLLVDAKTWYLYPLFPEGEVEDREVRVLVRTERAPERFVSYEDMVIEGRVSFPTSDEVPFGTEIEMGKRAGYFFSDRLVLLEPWRIDVAEEAPWTAPE